MRHKHLRPRSFSRALAGLRRSSTQLLCHQAQVQARVPRTLIAGQPGDRFIIKVEFFCGVRYLPIVTLKRAA